MMLKSGYINYLQAKSDNIDKETAQRNKSIEQIQTRLKLYQGVYQQLEVESKGRQGRFS